MVLTEAERKQRRRDGMARKEANMTAVEEIVRDFTVGRHPASELRTPAEAVYEARTLLAQLQAAMVREKVKDPKCGVKVAFVNTDFTVVATQPFIPGREAELLKILSEKPVLMLGLIFVLKDPDTTDDSRRFGAGMKPFLVTPEVVRWLKDLIMQAHSGIN